MEHVLSVVSSPMKKVIFGFLRLSSFEKLSSHAQLWPKEACGVGGITDTAIAFSLSVKKGINMSIPTPPLAPNQNKLSLTVVFSFKIQERE